MQIKVNEGFYELDKINPSQRQAVGEKALTLSQLSQKGYQIPSGVVVDREVLGSLLSAGGAFASLVELTLDLNDYETLQQTAQTLCEVINDAELDPEWCEELYRKLAAWESKTLIFRPSLVLPSPQVSVSGLLTSHCGLCERKEIELGLKRVWTSLFCARNLFYWQQQGMTWEELGLAVMIQPIQNAIASGILEVRDQQWHLQAVRGLGHSLIRGEVLPETYEINPTTQQVTLHQLGYQTCLYQLNPLLSVRTLETEAEKRILSTEQLSQLMNLAVTLKESNQQNFRCEWTFLPELHSANEPDHRSQLYLTQFSAEVTMLAQSPSGVLVKGIGSAMGKATGKVYVLGKDDAQGFPPGDILVIKSVTTENLSLIKRAGGLITEQGGMTSHGSILARELKIPAVVGAEGAIETLAGEEVVTVDGDKGEVLRPSQEEEEGVETTAVAEKTERTVLATQLMVNVSQRDRATELAQLPVEGVGLVRSELMLLELLEEQSLSTWLSSPYREQFIERFADLIGHLAKAFFPRPVFYRSTDGLSLQSEEAPLLGERGTYSYYKNPEFFSAQMFAVQRLQRQGYNNINLILPFVRSVEEVQFCKNLLTEIGLEKSCQLWMMAEVPSVVYLLSDYIEAGIEGIAIGTNDLTQLLLGVDREQGEFREHYNECHPALLAALKTLIETARAKGISCSVCGQGVVLYPELVSELIRWGITGISVEESAIETVYRAIARSEKQLLLAAARQQLKPNL